MKKIISTFLFTFIIGIAIAQPGKNYDPYTDHSTEQQEDPSYDWSWKSNNIPTAPPPPPTPVPIDGGIGFLLVAGLGYGLKRMKEK